MEVYKGTIVALHGSWGSGLAALVLNDGVSDLEVYCDNGTTVRALEACFGNVIGPNHTIDNYSGEQRRDPDTGQFLPQPGHIGKEIFWSYDEMGLVMAYFTPVDEAPDELIEAYEATLKGDNSGQEY